MEITGTSMRGKLVAEEGRLSGGAKMDGILEETVRGTGTGWGM